MTTFSGEPWRFSAFFRKAKAAHPVYPLLADVCGKHRAEPIPPVPYGLVADIDAAFEMQVLDVAQRQREPHIEQHR